jgi:hypothetical protein
MSAPNDRINLNRNRGDLMYKITVTYDEATKPFFTMKITDALEAFTEFAKFVDWGFADKYSTVNLSMPDGKMYTKIFYREGRKVVTK